MEYESEDVKDRNGEAKSASLIEMLITGKKEN